VLDGLVLGARPAEVPAGGALTPPDQAALGPAEHWILWRCAQVTVEVDAAYAAFQFGEVTRRLHDAIWNEYCDWYLELAKLQLGAGADPARRVVTWQTLTWVLDRYLRMLHPVMPHITEQIWGRLPHAPGDAKLLIISPWPDPRGTPAGVAAPAGAVAPTTDPSQARGVEQVLELIRAIRNARAHNQIEAGLALEASIMLVDPDAARTFHDLQQAFDRLARVRSHVASNTGELPATSDALIVLTDGAEARLARGDADLQRERERLERELEEASHLLATSEAKLANPAFVGRAPGPIVEAAQIRAAELRERIERLNERLAG